MRLLAEQCDARSVWLSERQRTATSGYSRTTASLQPLQLPNLRVPATLAHDGVSIPVFEGVTTSPDSYVEARRLLWELLLFPPTLI